MWKPGRRLTLHVGLDVLDALQLTRNPLLCAAYLFVGIRDESKRPIASVLRCLERHRRAARKTSHSH